MNERVAPAIAQLVKNRDWAGLRSALSKWPLPEIADLLLTLDKSDRVLVFRALPRDLSAEVASYLAPDKLNALLEELTDAETRQILADLRPDDRTALLEELPGQLTQRLLNLLSPEDLKEARQLLGYPEESVGRLMTPNYVAVRASWTVQQAIDHIRKKGKDSETINTIYVVDAGWKLLDTIELQQLILAEPNDRVEQLMDHSFVSISAFDDREKAVLIMQRYDVFALPVVDSTGILLGIITADDVMDVAQEEATEDFHKTAAVAPLADSYTETSIFQLYKKRVGWLMALVLINLVSSGIIAIYEETLASTIALAFFIPLLIDSGGNAGSQSATLMIRGLATGDLNLGQWARTLAKEMAVGGCLGLTLGIAASILGMYRGGTAVALVVGLSMALIVLASNVIGTILPFVFTRFRTDPAVASSPLITTIADSVGLLIYFTLAKLILS